MVGPCVGLSTAPRRARRPTRPRSKASGPDTRPQANALPPTTRVDDRPPAPLTKRARADATAPQRPASPRLTPRCPPKPTWPLETSGPDRSLRPTVPPHDPRPGDRSPDASACRRNRAPEDRPSPVLPAPRHPASPPSPRASAHRRDRAPQLRPSSATGGPPPAPRQPARADANALRGTRISVFAQIAAQFPSSEKLAFISKNRSKVVAPDGEIALRSVAWRARRRGHIGGGPWARGSVSCKLRAQFPELREISIY